MRRLVGILLAAVLLVVGAPVAGAVEPTGDPAADSYSPWVWLNAWADASARDTARAGDTTEGLQHSGMVVAAVPDQLNALTAEDKAQLDTSWHASGLLTLTYQRAQDWSKSALQAVADHQAVPAWSPADSDGVAGDLGGTSYAALTPGLKSVVQRIATIVTGDTKPPMPDDAWSTWMTPQVKAAFDARPDTRFDWAGVSQTPPGVTADPNSQVVTVCDAGAANFLCEATRAAVGAVAASVDFVSNPLGYLAAAFSAAAAWMMTFVANVANHGTAPDLTASWWISAYTKGMAIGVVLLGFVLLYEILQVARRKASADELLETISTWVPAWFAGVLFGPAVAQFLITGAGYLTDGIVSSMTGFGAGDAFTAVAQATKEAANAQQGGELVMALLQAIAVLVSALLVFISLCVQAVIIYLASAVFAIGWVWIITQRHRETAWRIPRLFIGLVFSKALLFFLLGVAMAIASAATSFSGDGVAKNLGLIVMACAAMLLAAFTPLMLLKHAPVIPGTSTSRGVGDAMSAAGTGARRAVRGGQQAIKGGSKLGALAAAGGGKGTGGAVNAPKVGRSMAIATPYRPPGQGAPTGGASALSAGAPTPGAPQVGGRPGRSALTAGASSLTSQTAGPTGSRPPGKSGKPRTFQSGSTSQQGPVSSAQRRIEQPSRKNIQTPPRRVTGGGGNASSSPPNRTDAAAPVQTRQTPDHQPAAPVEEPSR